MFAHDEINDFWGLIQGMIPREEHRGVVVELLQIIDGPDGDGPSLDANCPSTYWVTTDPGFLALREINLRRHVIHTAQEAAAMGNPLSGFFPLRIIAVLGHDLCKIRHFPWVKKWYAEQDHADDAAVYLNRLLRGRLNEKEIEAIVFAVRHHHDGITQGELAEDLKLADERARIRERCVEDPGVISKEEVCKAKRERRPLVIQGRVPDPDAVNIPWFRLKEYLWALKPKINMLPGVRAFSMVDTNTCFFHPSVFWETLEELAIERGWLQIFLIKENPQRRQDALAFVVREMRKAGFIPENLLSDERFHFRMFRVKYKNGGTQDFKLTPIKTKAFTLNPGALEKKKIGTIAARFSDVRIAYTKKEEV